MFSKSRCLVVALGIAVVSLNALISYFPHKSSLTFLSQLVGVGAARQMEGGWKLVPAMEYNSPTRASSDPTEKKHLLYLCGKCSW